MLLIDSSTSFGTYLHNPTKVDFCEGACLNRDMVLLNPMTVPHIFGTYVGIVLISLLIKLSRE